MSFFPSLYPSPSRHPSLFLAPSCSFFYTSSTWTCTIHHADDSEHELFFFFFFSGLTMRGPDGIKLKKKKKKMLGIKREERLD